MREIDASSAAGYLRDTGRASPSSKVRVRELPGGVSNIVLRVEVTGEPPYVIKQCRERLRVAMDWRARLERIWTESATLAVLGAIRPDGLVPQVLFEDRPNYLFAMSSAPDDAVTWKARLMGGCVDPAIASRLGTILGTIHALAPGHPALRGVLADTSLFDELRIDPYYRTTAQSHPNLAPEIDALIDAMALPDRHRTLVLGDFSPKNILVHRAGLMLLDFECAHAGDPAFDLGFFMSHLLLKAIRADSTGIGRKSEYLDLTRTFWRSYLGRRSLEPAVEEEFVRRSIRHTAACCLARVDGKSPVEYLDAGGQSVARAFGQNGLRSRPATWEKFLLWLKGPIEL
jgi:5-methylthioribose kinase